MDDGDVGHLFADESDNSVENFLEELWKNTHSCTHTHTCNPPGPDNAHTHTCTHTHTQLFASLDGKSLSGEAQNLTSSDHHSPSEPSSSSLNLRKQPQQGVGNREAVRKYREKKKAQTAHLEEEVLKLRAINQQLVKKLQGHASLEQDVIRLRRILAEFRGRIDGEIGPTSSGCRGRSQIDGRDVMAPTTSSLLRESQIDSGDMMPISSCWDRRMDCGDAITAPPSSSLCPNKIDSGDLGAPEPTLSSSCAIGQRIDGGDLASSACHGGRRTNGGDLTSSACKGGRRTEMDGRDFQVAGPTLSSKRGRRSTTTQLPEPMNTTACVVYEKERMGVTTITAAQPPLLQPTPAIISGGHNYLNACNVECHADVPCLYSAVAVGSSVENGSSTPQEHSSVAGRGSSLSCEDMDGNGNYSLRSSKRTKKKGLEP